MPRLLRYLSTIVPLASTACSHRVLAYAPLSLEGLRTGAAGVTQPPWLTPHLQLPMSLC